MNPPELTSTGTPPRTIPLKGILLALFLALIFSLALAPAASASPCCQSCDGWEDGEPPIGYDYCWSHCHICGNGGYCSESWCNDPGYDCVNSYCIFVGGELDASKSFDFIKNSRTLSRLYPTSAMSFRGTSPKETASQGCDDAPAIKPSRML